MPLAEIAVLTQLASTATVQALSSNGNTRRKENNRTSTTASATAAGTLSPSSNLRAALFGDGEREEDE